MKQPGAHQRRHCGTTLLRNIRLGVFGTLLVLAKKITSTTWVEIVFLVVRAAQMLAFPLTNERTAAGFRYATITPVKLLSSLTTPTRFFPMIPAGAYVALWYTAIAWMALLAALVVWASVSYVRQSFAALWPLRVLRVQGTLSITILFIPLVGVLLSPFRCRDPEATFWVANGYDCSSAAFIALQGIGAVLALLLLGVAALFAVSFYDGDPLSRQIVARAHGRQELVNLLVAFGLSLTLDIFAFNIASVWVLIVALVIAGVAWLGSLLIYLPFYNHAWNGANAAAAAAFLFTSASLILNEIYPQGDTALVIYVGAPFAAATGVLLANWRAAAVQRKAPLRISNAFELELRARYMLHTALYGHPTMRVQFGAREGQAETERLLKERTSAAAMAGAGSFIGGGSSTALAASGDANASASNRAGRALNAIASAAGGGSNAASALDPQAALEDAEGGSGQERVRALRRLIPASVMAEVTDLYKGATARFSSSAWAHVFFARFYALFAGNRHMQMSHLLMAERRKPPFDVAFAVFQARKLAETETGGGGGSGGGGSGGSGSGVNGMSAIHRVAFESLSADARRFVMRAALRQSAFFAELCNPQPDLSRLHRIGSEMHDAIAGAERAFSELFAISPQSLAVMRLYAAFAMYVSCDNEKAAALLAEADRLEDAKARDHRSDGAGTLLLMSESGLDVFADSTAVITIGATRNLGLVLSANAPATRLFGYSRLQLERRDLFSTLLPPPLAQEHDTALRAYVDTGEGMWGTRVVLGLHRAGHAFPMLLTVRETPVDDGPPSFIVLARELRSQDSYILMSNAFTVTAACSQTLLALGIDGQALAGAELCIRDCIAEWDALLPEMQRHGAPAVTLRIDPPREGASAAAVAAALAATSAAAAALASPGPASGPFAGAATGYANGYDGFAAGAAAGAAARGGLHVRTPARQTGKRQRRREEADSDAGSAKAVGNDDGGDSGDESNGHTASAGLRAVATADPLLPDHHHAGAVGSPAGGGSGNGGSGEGSPSVAGTWARAQLHRVPLPALGKACWALHWQAIPPADAFAVLKADARRRAALLSMLPPDTRTALAVQMGRSGPMPVVTPAHAPAAGGVGGPAGMAVGEPMLLSPVGSSWQQHRGRDRDGWLAADGASPAQQQPHSHGMLSPYVATGAAGLGGSQAALFLPPIAPARALPQAAPNFSAGPAAAGLYAPGMQVMPGIAVVSAGSGFYGPRPLAPAGFDMQGRALGGFQGISDSSSVSYLSGANAAYRPHGIAGASGLFGGPGQAEQYNAAVAMLQAQAFAQGQAAALSAQREHEAASASRRGRSLPPASTTRPPVGASASATSDGTLSPGRAAFPGAGRPPVGAGKAAAAVRSRSWRAGARGGRADDEASLSGSAIFSAPDGTAVPLTGAALEAAVLPPGSQASRGHGEGVSVAGGHPFAATAGADADDAAVHSPLSNAVSASAGSRSPQVQLPPIAVKGTRLGNHHHAANGAASGGSALRLEVKPHPDNASGAAAGAARTDGSPTPQADPLRELLREGQAAQTTAAPQAQASAAAASGSNSVTGVATRSPAARDDSHDGSTSSSAASGSAGAAATAALQKAALPVPREFPASGAVQPATAAVAAAGSESARPVQTSEEAPATLPVAVASSSQSAPRDAVAEHPYLHAHRRQHRHSMTGSASDHSGMDQDQDTYRAIFTVGKAGGHPDGSGAGGSTAVGASSMQPHPLRGWNSAATGSVHHVHAFSSAADSPAGLLHQLNNGTPAPNAPPASAAAGPGALRLAPGPSQSAYASAQGLGAQGPPGILKVGGQGQGSRTGGGGGRSSIVQLSAPSPGIYGPVFAGSAATLVAPGSAAGGSGAVGHGVGPTGVSAEDPRLASQAHIMGGDGGQGQAADGAGHGGQPQIRSVQIGGDNKSATSGGSGSTHKALTRLRRVLSDSQQPLLPGLKYLRLAGLAVTLLSVALAAATVTVTIQSFAQYQQAVAYTRDGGHRITATYAAINSAQELINAAKGWTPFATPEAEAATRSAIIRNMSDFTSLHKAMYDFAAGTSIESTYTTRDVTILRFDVPGGSVRGAPQIMNLVEVGLAFAAELKALAHLPLSNLSNWQNPSARYLQANLMPRGWAHEELQESLDSGFLLAYESRLDLRRTQIIIFASMAALLVALALFVFLPILVYIESGKDAVVIAFVQLPPMVKRMLFVQSVRRARTLRRNYLSTDEDDDDEADGDDDGDDEAAALGLVNATGGGGGGDDDHDGAGEYGAGGNVAGVPPFLAVAIGAEGEDGVDGNGEDIDWGAVMDRAEGAAGVASKFGSGRLRSTKSVGSASGPLPSPGSHGGNNFQYSRTNSVGSAGSAGRASGPGPMPPSTGLRSSTSKVAPGTGTASPSGRPAAGVASPSASGSRSGSGRSGSGSRGSSRSGRAGSGKPAAAVHVKPFRKSWRSFLLLLLRFQGPLLALLIFFSVTFGVSMHELDTTLALSSAALAATERAACSRELVMDLRRLVGTWAERPFVKARYLDLAEVRDCINYNNQLLAFGRPPGPARGLHVATTPVLESGSTAAALLGVEASATISSAFFGDACEYAAGSPFRLQSISDADFRARCETWSSGLMKEGLEATMSEYLRRMAVVADARLRARMGAPGRGVEFPEVGYNYSGDTCPGDSAMNCFDGEMTPEGVPYGGIDGLPSTCWQGDLGAARLICKPVPPTPVFSYTGDFMWAPDGVTPLNFSMAATGAIPYRVADVLKAEDIEWLEDADRLFLTPTLFAAAESYASAAIASVAGSMQFLVAFAAAFLSAFVIFMLLVFVPAVRRTNADVTSRRGMLLYLPPEVASKSRSIKALVQSILAADSERAGLGVPTIAALGLATSASAGRMAADPDTGGDDTPAGAAAGTGQRGQTGVAAAARMSDEPAIVTQTASSTRSGS